MNLIGSLCYLYNASEEDVSCMVSKLNKMMEDLLKLPLSDASPGDSPQLSGINSGVYRSFLCFKLLVPCLVQVGYAFWSK